jgi:hypothetical protein
MEFMSNWKVNALWALISFPIAGIALLMSFALAHGSLFILLVLNYPALLALEFLSHGHATTLDVTLSLIFQYLSYFALIALARKTIYLIKGKQ